MSCTEHYTRVHDINLCWFEWHPQKKAEGTILLVHATGFHARCWDQTIAHLGERHVVAVDMRGHGRSDKVPQESWQTFGDDLSALLDSLSLDRLVGVGHSMGGHSVIQAAAKLPARFSRLVLIDPVVMAPEAYETETQAHAAWLTDDGEHPVARRKNFFATVDAMVDNFRGRGSYGLWQDEVLQDYCRYGLLPNPEGEGFVLACPPRFEASVYMGSTGTNVYEQVSRISIPVKVLRAKQRDPDNTQMDFSTSPTWEKLAEQFEQGTDVFLPELSHFIPMQDPALTAEHILDESV